METTGWFVEWKRPGKMLLTCRVDMRWGVRSGVSGFRNDFFLYSYLNLNRKTCCGIQHCHVPIRIVSLIEPMSRRVGGMLTAESQQCGLIEVEGGKEEWLRSGEFD